MNSNGTICGQTKHYSISKALPMYKTEGYGQWKIFTHAPVPPHSTKTTVWCGLTTSFIVDRPTVFREDMCC